MQSEQVVADLSNRAPPLVLRRHQQRLHGVNSERLEDGAKSHYPIMAKSGCWVDASMRITRQLPTRAKCNYNDWNFRVSVP